MNIELVKVLTPSVLGLSGAFFGALIAIIAILTPSISDSKFAILMNFAIATTATGLGGAAGVAQQPRLPIIKEDQENIEEIKK